MHSMNTNILLPATWHHAGIAELFTLNPVDLTIFGIFTFRPNSAAHA